jgi:hypothetical protein
MAEPDNPVDFLRNRRAAAASAGNGGTGAAARPPANVPELQQEAFESETFDNPTHAGTLEDMEPGDLMEGTGQAAMHQPAKPAASGGGDGAAVIGSQPPGSGGGGVGGGIGKMLMVAVLGVLVVGFVFFMTKGSEEGPAGEPAAEPVLPGDLESSAPDRCADVVCSAASGPCKLAGECTDGVCSAETNAPDNTQCDDGDSGTTDDVCTSGACSGTVPVPPPPRGGDGPHVPAPCRTPGQMAVAVQVATTTQYSDEIRWDIDGGTQFDSFEDNQVYYEDLCLPFGSHTIHYFDSYGDGWGEGAYWALLDSSGGLIAGGPDDGAVVGAGGETEFTLVEGGPAVSSVEVPVTITIFANGEYSHEISWNIDGGDPLPLPQNPYESGNEYVNNLQLPEGRHTFYFFDEYGDGWSDGYWQIEAGGILIAGGPVDGLVDGAGGTREFCLTCCDPPCREGEGSSVAGATTSVTVEIQTSTWATEIQWNLDAGPLFPTEQQAAYSDNTLIVEGPFALTEGEHTFNFFDTYGDGWGEGAFWTIKSSDGEVIAGGPTEGVVLESGGEDTFCAGTSCDGYVDRAEVSITVTIDTRNFANEVTWDIDGGTTFGEDPPFEDNSVTEEVLQLPAGEHTIHYFDSYGDGWHGGYWTISDCRGTRSKPCLCLRPYFIHLLTDS